MKRTRGFTLVELLVVIAIIGILVGLLLPAVGAIRERTRSTQCSNRVRQLALAALQYETSKGKMPGYLNKYGVFPGGVADPTDPGNNGGSVPRHVKVGGYGVGMLPYVDAQGTYEHWSQDKYPVITDGNGDYPSTTRLSGVGFHALAAPNLAVFRCPSNPNEDGSNGLNSYVPNNGMCHFRTGVGQIIHFATAESRANGVFNAKYVGVTMSPDQAPDFCGKQPGPDLTLDDIKDGKSGTMLFGENVQALPWHRPGFLQGVDLTNTVGTNNDELPATTNLLISKFTNGMVWHFEDNDAGQPHIVSLTGDGTCIPATTTIAAIPVNAIHKINGGGRTGSGSLFTRIMQQGDCHDLARPSSAHVEGFNAGFADGATRFVSSSIDYRAYQALLTTRGKSSNVPFTEFVLTDEIEQ